MKDYGNKDSWTKLFTVPFEDLFIVPFEDVYANLVYIYEEDDQVLLEISYKLYVYDYKNGTVKSLEISRAPFYFVRLSCLR
jgi:hypothetical protein